MAREAASPTSRPREPPIPSRRNSTRGCDATARDHAPAPAGATLACRHLEHRSMLARVRDSLHRRWKRKRASRSTPVTRLNWTKHEHAGSTGTHARKRVPKRASPECCNSRDAAARSRQVARVYRGERRDLLARPCGRITTWLNAAITRLRSRRSVSSSARGGWMRLIASSTSTGARRSCAGLGPNRCRTAAKRSR